MIWDLSKSDLNLEYTIKDTLIVPLFDYDEYGCNGWTVPARDLLPLVIRYKIDYLSVGII